MNECKTIPGERDDALVRLLALDPAPEKEPEDVIKAQFWDGTAPRRRVQETTCRFPCRSGVLKRWGALCRTWPDSEFPPT